MSEISFWRNYMAEQRQTIEELEAELADLRRRSVEIWEDCPTCKPPCPRDTNGDGDCGQRMCPVCYTACPDCGGSGLQLKDGVVDAIANVLHDHGDRTDQRHTTDWRDCGGADVHGAVAEKIAKALPAEMVEGA